MLSQKNKYNEFIEVCRIINEKLGVTPVLFGSLGLEVLTSSDFYADDIDVLVPEIYLNNNWGKLKKVVEKLGYIFIDLHEHEFKKNDVKLAFGVEESLIDFADVDYGKLEIIRDGSARFKLLDPNEYLKVYNKSYKDSYRRDKNNGKDRIKIKFLEEYIKNNLDTFQHNKDK